VFSLYDESFWIGEGIVSWVLILIRFLGQLYITIVHSSSSMGSNRQFLRETGEKYKRMPAMMGSLTRVSPDFPFMTRCIASIYPPPLTFDVLERR